MVLVTAYQIGFGPISWLILAEVCPLRVKGAMLGLGVTVNFGFNIVATSSLPVLNAALGMPGLFALYALVAAIALVFARTCVPETKGKTLEEIEAELGLANTGGPPGGLGGLGGGGGGGMVGAGGSNYAGALNGGGGGGGGDGAGGAAAWTAAEGLRKRGGPNGESGALLPS